MLYNHAEAFCLMQYQDDITGEVEIIWNSRDGITAFITTSRQGNSCSHIDFDQDIRQPNYVPNVGERVWVTLTIERAREYRKEMVEERWDKEMRETWETKEEAVEELAQSDVGNYGGGAPSLVVVTEEIQAGFRQAQQDRWALCGALGHSKARNSRFA